MCGIMHKKFAQPRVVILGIDRPYLISARMHKDTHMHLRSRTTAPSNANPEFGDLDRSFELGAYGRLCYATRTLRDNARLLKVASEQVTRTSVIAAAAEQRAICGCILSLRDNRINPQTLPSACDVG